MHSYNWHIGDYISHTRHLTPIEDICYRRALDYYYLHEKPLTSDINHLARILSLRGCEAELKNVMTEFFELENDVYKNSRADQEIVKFQSFAEHGKRGAEKRWKGKKNDSPPNGEGISPPIDTLLSNDKGGYSPPKQTLIATNNHKPITNINPYPLTTFEDAPPLTENQPAEKKPDPVPYQQIADLYNRICTDLPKCATLNEKRKKAIKARWNSTNSNGEYTRRSLEWWERFFTKVHKSDFLNGRQKGSDYVANFDFTVTEGSFIKICEGTYDNRGGR